MKNKLTFWSSVDILALYPHLLSKGREKKGKARIACLKRLLLTQQPILLRHVLYAKDLKDYITQSMSYHTITTISTNLFDISNHSANIPLLDSVSYGHRALVQAYLKSYYSNPKNNTVAFASCLDREFVQPILAKTKLECGDANIEKWCDMLPTAEVKQLKEIESEQSRKEDEQAMKDLNQMYDPETGESAW